MTLMEALEAVADAARLLIDNAGLIYGRTPEDADTYIHEREHGQALLAALQRLDDAEEGQSVGEAITLTVYADHGGGAHFSTGPEPNWSAGWTRLGTVRLPLMKGGEG